MGKRPRGQSIPLLLGPMVRPGQPLYLQLYQRIRQAVLQGAVPPGTRLPSARTLAREEGISRNTVEAALGQLQAEGFVVRRVGAGTWVSERIPELPLQPRRPRAAESRHPRIAAAVPSPRPGPSRLSARGRAIATARLAGGSELLFQPCVPGLDTLPLDSWNRIAARLARRASASLLVPPPPDGLRELREAIAGYVSLDRGVRCTAEQVVIVSSAQQAIDLSARLLLAPGDAVWFEDPGYPSARYALETEGARLVPVPIDAEGMDVGAGVGLAPSARLAYVTPSHQYPLGVTLSLPRRLALIDWAESAGSWILEDDYDSELRYTGRPYASLQGIDASNRVLYMGTFNKILFPALRIAYLVLPSQLVEAFTRGKELLDGFTPPFFQHVLAEFIAEGYFSIHLRRVRALYKERRDTFLEAGARYFPEGAVIGSADAGIHVALHVPADVDDEELSRSAHRRGLAVPALSRYCVGSRARGLLVHYGHAPVAEIGRGTRVLAEILEASLAGARAVRRRRTSRDSGDVDPAGG